MVPHSLIPRVLSLFGILLRMEAGEGINQRSIGAVDLGGTRVRTAVVDPAGRLAGKRDEFTRHMGGPATVIEQIARMMRQSTEDCGMSLAQLSHVTVGSPGPLNTDIGVVYDAPNLPGWVNVQLRDELEVALGVPVHIVNDANAAALGEYLYGTGRGHRSFVYITVSTGIGGGVVINGRLLEGSAGTAGEIGHMTIDRDGPPCKCGSIGCLETLASGTAIARRFVEALDAGGTSSVTGWVERDRIGAEHIVKAAYEGDRLAYEVFTDSATALGFGVVNCVNLFNPDVVAIGGGVSQAGPLLFDTVERVVRKYALGVPLEAVRVVATQLGEDVGLLGAAAVPVSVPRRALQ